MLAKDLVDACPDTQLPSLPDPAAHRTAGMDACPEKQPHRVSYVSSKSLWMIELMISIGQKYDALKPLIG
jgi:hypothetical protein